MKCSELQLDLAVFADGTLDISRNEAVQAHLDTCPLCRQKASELVELRTDLTRLSRPQVSLALQRRFTEAVRLEARRSRREWLPVPPDVREWLQMRVMPIGVGVMGSLIVGFGFLGMLFSGMFDPVGRETAVRSNNRPVFLASNRDPYAYLNSEVINPTDYARTRFAVAAESPSVNPQGALVALTRSLVRGSMSDDEVVVVADVFGNGLARVAEVVEPSHDRRAVIELQKALDTDPAFAPFVPAALDERPESVRVVLKFKSVDVTVTEKRPRNRTRL